MIGFYSGKLAYFKEREKTFVDILCIVFIRYLSVF